MTGVDPLELAAELGRGLIAGDDGASLVIVNPDLRIVLADGGARRSFEQWSAGGERLSDVLPAGGWRILGPRFHAALGGEAQSFEYDALTEGTTDWVRLVPIADGSRVVGVMVLTQDVTAKANGQPQIESSSLDLRRQLREAHEMARLSSWEWSPDTGQVVILQPLAESETLTGSAGTLDDLLLAMPDEQRQAARATWSRWSVASATTTCGGRVMSCRRVRRGLRRARGRFVAATECCCTCAAPRRT